MDRLRSNLQMSRYNDNSNNNKLIMIITITITKSHNNANDDKHMNNPYSYFANWACLQKGRVFP